MGIYKVNSPTGRDYYVEDHELIEGAEAGKPEGDYIYVVTRSEHPTSLFCQIESIGWIDRSLIEPLNPKLKRDRAVIKRIRDAERKGQERSQIWYDMMKAKEG